MTQSVAPGARVLIRDEEWIVRSVELCDVGCYQLQCIGVSGTVRANASAAEETAFAQLAAPRLHMDADRRGADMLFRTMLERSLLSSPVACAQTLRERIARVQKQDADHPDLSLLSALQRAADTVRPEEVSKLNELVACLTDDTTWRWDGREYVAPFSLADQKDGYKVAWAGFERRRGLGTPA